LSPARGGIVLCRRLGERGHQVAALQGQGGLDTCRLQPRVERRDGVIEISELELQIRQSTVVAHEHRQLDVRAALLDDSSYPLVEMKRLWQLTQGAVDLGQNLQSLDQSW